MFKEWKKSKGVFVSSTLSILEAVVLGVIVGGLLHIIFPKKVTLSVITIIAVSIVWYTLESRE